MKRERTLSFTSSSRNLKKCKYEVQEDEDDRISGLPDPILHNILSYLPIKDAAKTCALSKTWYSLWKSIPWLDFDQYAFQQSACSRKCNFKKSKKSVLQDFCDCIETTINSRSKGVITSNTILRLRVVLNMKNCKHILDRCVNYAVDNNVQELVLDRHKFTVKSKVQWQYLLPQSLFRANSLKILDLFGCKFQYLGNNFKNIWPSLRKLNFSYVDIDQETFQSVVSSCTLLQELKIEVCKGFEVVKVPGVKLERVDLYLDRDEVQIVSVAAPNLRFLSYGGGFDSVRGSLLSSSESCGNLKELIFHDVDVTDQFVQVNVRNFRQLETLKLERCFSLERIDLLSELSIDGRVKLKKINVGDDEMLTLFSRFEYKQV